MITLWANKIGRAVKGSDKSNYHNIMILDDFQYFFVPEGRVLLPQGRKLLSQETTRFVPFDPGSVVLGLNSEIITQGTMWAKYIPIKVFPPSPEELNQFEKIRAELGLEMNTFSKPPLIFRRKGIELFSD